MKSVRIPLTSLVCCVYVRGHYLFLSHHDTMVKSGESNHKTSIPWPKFVFPELICCVDMEIWSGSGPVIEGSCLVILVGMQSGEIVVINISLQELIPSLHTLSDTMPRPLHFSHRIDDNLLRLSTSNGQHQELMYYQHTKAWVQLIHRFNSQCSMCFLFNRLILISDINGNVMLIPFEDIVYAVGKRIDLNVRKRSRLVGFSDEVAILPAIPTTATVLSCADAFVDLDISLDQRLEAIRINEISIRRKNLSEVVLDFEQSVGESFVQGLCDLLLIGYSDGTIHRAMVPMSIFTDQGCFKIENSPCVQLRPWIKLERSISKIMLCNLRPNDLFSISMSHDSMLASPTAYSTMSTPSLSLDEIMLVAKLPSAWTHVCIVSSSNIFYSDTCFVSNSLPLPNQSNLTAFGVRCIRKFIVSDNFLGEFKHCTDVGYSSDIIKIETYLAAYGAFIGLTASGELIVFPIRNRASDIDLLQLAPSYKLLAALSPRIIAACDLKIRSNITAGDEMVVFCSENGAIGTFQTNSSEPNKLKVPEKSATAQLDNELADFETLIDAKIMRNRTKLLAYPGSKITIETKKRPGRNSIMTFFTHASNDIQRRADRESELMNRLNKTNIELLRISSLHHLLCRSIDNKLGQAKLLEFSGRNTGIEGNLVYTNKGTVASIWNSQHVCVKAQFMSNIALGAVSLNSLTTFAIEISIETSDALFVRAMQDRLLMISWLPRIPLPGIFNCPAQCTEQRLHFVPREISRDSAVSTGLENYIFRTCLAVPVPIICQYILNLDILCHLNNTFEERLSPLRHLVNSCKKSLVSTVQMPLFRQVFSYSDILPFVSPVKVPADVGVGCHTEPCRSLKTSSNLARSSSIAILSSCSDQSNTCGLENVSSLISQELSQIQAACHKYAVSAAELNHLTLGQALNPFFRRDTTCTGSLRQADLQGHPVHVKKLLKQCRDPLVHVHTVASVRRSATAIRTGAHAEFPMVPFWRVSCDSPSILTAMHAASRRTSLLSCRNPQIGSSEFPIGRTIYQYSYRDQYSLPKSFRDLLAEASNLYDELHLVISKIRKSGETKLPGLESSCAVPCGDDSDLIGAQSERENLTSHAILEEVEEFDRRQHTLWQLYCKLRSLDTTPG